MQITRNLEIINNGKLIIISGNSCDVVSLPESDIKFSYYCIILDEDNIALYEDSFEGQIVKDLTTKEIFEIVKLENNILTLRKITEE